MQSAFLGGGIDSLQDLDNQGWVAGTSANVFVADHDTERSGASLNYSSPSNAYVLAHIFSLAHPYGTPTVLSSFEFSDFDQGAPDNGTGTCTASGGQDGWLCQHRWPAIAGMVGFRASAGSANLTDWSSPSLSQIAFGRGSGAFVAINNEDSDWSTTFQTSLAAGSYCEVTSGPPSSNGSCAGAAFTVGSDGTFTGTISSRAAIALHTGAMGTGNSTGSSGAEIDFAETATTTYGEGASRNSGRGIPVIPSRFRRTTTQSGRQP